MSREYAARTRTEIYLSDDDTEPYVLSWPPQVDELKRLSIWREVEKELAALPEIPSLQNFESYCLSIMGKTLYGLFIEGYTIKQWDATPLSSRAGSPLIGSNCARTEILACSMTSGSFSLRKVPNG